MRIMTMWCGVTSVEHAAPFALTPLAVRGRMAGMGSDAAGAVEAATHGANTTANVVALEDTGFKCPPAPSSWVGPNESWATIEEELFKIFDADVTSALKTMVLGIDGGASSKDFEAGVLAAKLQANEKAEWEAFQAQLSARDRAFQEAVQQNNFDIRSSLGQQFARESKTTEYTGLKTHTEKQAFRMEWARKKLEAVRERYESSKTYKSVSADVGTYMSFSRIVTEEGGRHDQQAIAAACRYVGKCVQLGRPWVLLNSMTERVDYLYVRKTHTHIMEESWTKYQEHMPAVPALAAEVAAPEALPCPSLPKTKGKAVAKGKAAAKKCADSTGSKAEETEPSPKKATTELTAALRLAQRLKTRISTANASCSALQVSIQHEQAWSWAKQDAFLQPLVTAQMALNEALRTTFYGDLSLQDTGYLKKHYNDTELYAAVCQFNTAMPQLLSSLETQTKNLMAMHKARA